jgi:hypothetical protein
MARNTNLRFGRGENGRSHAFGQRGYAKRALLSGFVRLVDIDAANGIGTVRSGPQFADAVLRSKSDPLLAAGYVAFCVVYYPAQRNMRNRPDR